MENIRSIFTKNIYAICFDIRNDNNYDKIYLNSNFTIRFPYSISFDKYVERFMKFAFVDNEYLIGIYIYFQRLKKLNYFFTEDNIHKLFAAFAIIFSKTFSDEFLCMSTYSRISGIPRKDLFLLELDVLFILEWNIMIEKEEFTKILRNCETETETETEKEEQIMDL
jgi:hypothetical protein